jgi:hypothetical protein
MIDLSAVASKPITTTQIGDTKVYIYCPSRSDIAKLEELSGSDAHTAFRTLLRLVCSDVDSTGKSREHRNKLTESAILVLVEQANELARTFLTSSFLRLISESEDLPERAVGEDDVQLLMRSVEQRIHAQKNYASKQFALLSGLEGSRFKELSRATELLRHSADANNQIAQRHRERARELTAQEQTATMTAQSVQALVKLIETTAIFIDEFDKRSQKADETTAHQIDLAKRGIHWSVRLALIAMLLSGAALWQDYRNNAANDKWQDEILSSVKREIERSTTARETSAKTTVAIPLQVNENKVR